MVKKFKTTIMIKKGIKENLERNNVDIERYVKLEAISRMTNEICDFIDLIHNDVIFDKGFERYEATLILATKDKEEEENA